MTYAQNLSPVLVWRIASLLTRKPDFSDLLNHWGRFRRCHASTNLVALGLTSP